jgi:hypothetical protein
MSKHNIYNIAKVTRKELQGLINKHFDPSWACSCAVCSWQLTKVLKNFGYNSIFAIGSYNNDNHAFVIVDCQIVDITGTQFNLKEIEIRNFDDRDYAVELMGQPAIKDLINWPKEQQPRTYRKYLDKAFSRTLIRLT